jgi:hypothetical protein
MFLDTNHIAKEHSWRGSKAVHIRDLWTMCPCRSSIVWDMMPCRTLTVNGRFRGTCCQREAGLYLLPASRWPLAWLIPRPWKLRQHFPQNINWLLKYYIVLYPRRWNAKLRPLLEHQLVFVRFLFPPFSLPRKASVSKWMEPFWRHYSWSW